MTTDEAQTAKDEALTDLFCQTAQEIRATLIEALVTLGVDRNEIETLDRIYVEHGNRKSLGYAVSTRRGPTVWFCQRGTKSPAKILDLVNCELYCDGVGVQGYKCHFYRVEEKISPRKDGFDLVTLSRRFVQLRQQYREACGQFQDEANREASEREQCKTRLVQHRQAGADLVDRLAQRFNVTRYRVGALSNYNWSGCCLKGMSVDHRELPHVPDGHVEQVRIRIAFHQDKLPLPLVAQALTALTAQAPAGVQLWLSGPDQQFQIYCEVTEAQAQEFIPVLQLILEPLASYA